MNEIKSGVYRNTMNNKMKLIIIPLLSQEKGKQNTDKEVSKNWYLEQNNQEQKTQHYNTFT